jgi:hypothetical protein
MTKLMRGSVRKRRAVARGNSFEVKIPGGQRPSDTAHPVPDRWRILAESKALKVKLPPSRISGSLGVRKAVANATRVTASGRVRRLREGEKP